MFTFDLLSSWPELNINSFKFMFSYWIFLSCYHCHVIRYIYAVLWKEQKVSAPQSNSNVWQRQQSKSKMQFLNNDFCAGKIKNISLSGPMWKSNCLNQITGCAIFLAAVTQSSVCNMLLIVFNRPQVDLLVLPCCITQVFLTSKLQPDICKPDFLVNMFLVN